MTENRRQQTRRKSDQPLHRARVVVGVMLSCAALVAALWMIQRDGQLALRDSSRAGCERAKLDRYANARGWRNAEAARREDREFQVAAIYAGIARELEMRSRVDCDAAFR
jgi:hypothetical protein